ncbi:hypothetical protein LUZ60_000595 [Juncus effusus]|nr:hypothetical protein LUZ60_000595 [Juncus effusus]
MAFNYKLFILLLILSKTKFSSSCFTHIFCFGDSISDTGNIFQISQDHYDPVRYLPYGETYFGRATGRFCDGRIILDFIAEEYGLPFIPAYLSSENANDFPHGVNFAVGGATALNKSFFKSKGIHLPGDNYTLDVQLQWFKQLLPSILQDSGYGSEIISNALFVVGEIGGNDYNYPLFYDFSLDLVQTLVPSVIKTISSAITELIGLGARTLLVPGNFPIGCVPTYLTQYMSQNNEDYNAETGCINWLNDFSKYHNKMLVEELNRLRDIHSNVTIIYADYFEATMNIFRNSKKLGFSHPLEACCGSEGPYNYNGGIPCGYKDSTVCSDPSKYGSWDGLHLTEAAYRVIANGVLHGPHTSPDIRKSCSFVQHSSA